MTSFVRRYHPEGEVLWADQFGTHLHDEATGVAVDDDGNAYALGRFREVVYVNLLGGDEEPDHVREAYGDSVYDRLVDVKTTYDPDNVFHHNHNIRPGLSDAVGGFDGLGDG